MPTTVEGGDDVAKKLEHLGKQFGDQIITGVVGYDSPYGLYVHEDIEMKWRGLPRKSGIGEYWGPHGQAKFLEQPARENAHIYERIIQDTLERGGTLEQAIAKACFQLQRDSAPLVPVEYGNLKASSFVEIKKG